MAQSRGNLQGDSTQCQGVFLPSLLFIDFLFLFFLSPGQCQAELMNYPNIYSVWKENTYHMYL